VGGKPVLVAVPVSGVDHDQLGPVDLGRDRLCGLGIRRPRDQQRGTRVAQDAHELRLREPPVQRHRDRTHLRGGEQQLDRLGRGPVQVRDACSRAGAGGKHRLCQSIRPLVELGIGERTLGVAKRDDVGSLRRVDAHDVRDPELAAAPDAHAFASSRKSPIWSSTAGCSVG
jgi:hypothetical protein